MVEAVAGARRSGAKPTLAPRLVLPGRFTNLAIGGAGRQNLAHDAPLGAQSAASAGPAASRFQVKWFVEVFYIFPPAPRKPLIGLSGTKHALAMVDSQPTKVIL